MKKIILSSITMASLAFGSATIISGSEQTMNFSSDPEGVQVKMNGNLICTTPCMKVINKHTGNVLTFEKEGYKKREMIMSESINVLTILGGILGTTTDSSTGALWEYDPDNYYIELRPNDYRWSFNNKYLDKNILSDIRSFILINYNELKLEYKLNYKTNYNTNNLVKLLSKYFNLTNSKAIEFLKDSISETTNPIELLNIVKIQKNIRN